MYLDAGHVCQNLYISTESINTNATDAVGRRIVGRKQGSIVNIIGLGGKVASSLHLSGGAANSALMLVTVGLAQAYGREGR